MKKIYRLILFVITVSAIFIGCMIHLGSFAGIDIPFGYFFKESVLSDSFTPNGDVSELKADLSVAEVEIKNGSEFKVEYNGSKKLKPSYDYDPSDKKLKIKQPKKNKNGIGMRTENTLIITIPKDSAFKDIDITIDVGNFNSVALVAKDVDIKCDVGSMNIEGIACDELEAKNDVGDINIADCIGKDIKAKSDVGSVNIIIADNLDEYSIKAKASVGDITIGDDSFSGNYEKKSGSKKIDLESGVGNVSIN